VTPLPLSLALYRAAAAAAEPFAGPLLARRVRRGKEDPARLRERLGHASAPRPEGRLVWLHGASVGEGLSLLPLVEALHDRAPDLHLLVTSGTMTSAELLGRRLPPGATHQYLPIDAPKAAARFLEGWRPDLVVLAESELWPNLILQAQARGARLALISARLSPGSLKGWTRAPASARRLFSAFDLVMAQEDDVAEGLARLGARDDGRLNLKLAGEALPVDEAALEGVRAAAGARAVLLAASTHPGEENAVLDAYAALVDRPDRPLLVLAPRHPVRGSEVAALAAGRGFEVRRQGAGEAFDGQAAVHVADGLGELGLWFRAARAAFIGGSLVEGVGGHNPLEPARLGTPMIAGPHVDNWRAVYAALGDRAARVDGAQALAAAFAEALDSPEATAVRAAHARALAEAGANSLETAVDRLLELLR